MLQQDLHIHTTYSTGDSAVVPEQTVALVAAVRHARIIGISDHLDYLVNGEFEGYDKELRQFGFKVGVEVDGQGGGHAVHEIPVGGVWRDNHHRLRNIRDLPAEGPAGGAVHRPTDTSRNSPVTLGNPRRELGESSATHNATILRSRRVA